MVSHPEVFLHPGEFFFGEAPRRVGTLLGSCIAVTMWCQPRQIGGMCHILLPGRQGQKSVAPDGRFADEAVELFMRELAKRGLTAEGCETKLFGGGNMFAGLAGLYMNVGQRNIEATRRALSRHGVTPMVEHVGGTSRRRLHFDLTNGHVWVTATDKKNKTNKECA